MEYSFRREYLFSFEAEGYSFKASRARNTVAIGLNYLSGSDVFSIEIDFKEDAFNDMEALKEEVIRIVTNHLRLPTGGS